MRHKWTKPLWQKKYVWKLKRKHNIIPTLKWCIIKSVPSYSNITKSCMLCLHEKLPTCRHVMPTWPTQIKMSYWTKDHVNKYLLSNYKANDWHSVWYLSHSSIIQLLINYCNIVSISSGKIVVNTRNMKFNVVKIYVVFL